MRQNVSLCLLAGAAVGLSATAQANDEVRAIVAEMMADAEQRSSLLQGGGMGGHDGDFFLADGAGNFRLEVGGQVQFRWVVDFRDDVDADDDGIDDEDDFEHGFQTRRTKLWFEGHIYDPNLIYKVQGAFDRDGGLFELEDAWGGYKFDNGGVLRWGQFKAPLLREELVSSKRQLAAERSATNEFFTGNRTQGVWWHQDGESFRYDLSFNDGLNTSNSEFDADGTDFSITGRGEFLLSGNWDQFKDFTSPMGSDMGAMIGVAGHYQTGADMPAGDGPDVFAYTVDASLEGNGWNAYGAFMGTNTDPDVGDSRDDFGWLIQGGVMLSEDWEFFARYDHIIQDDDIVDDEDFKTVTVGVNNYIHGHAAKFSLDLSWYLDESNVFVDDGLGGTENVGIGRDDGLGRLGSAEEDEITIRAQFQIVF